MTRLRRHRSAFLAAFCALVATVLVLLAVDARAWQTTVARDDLRFRAIPGHPDLWKPPTILPGDPASELIGTGSTMQYRRALQYFVYSHTGADPEVRLDTPTLRADAQDRLQTLISAAPNARLRSAAANLLGVLVVTAPAPGSDQNAIKQILVRAQEYFQQAVAIDPGNVDAKQNLELVLRLQRPGNGKLGNDLRRGTGFGRGRTAGTAGSGY